MNEKRDQVSCQVLGALFYACEQKSIDVGWVLEEIPYDMAHIRKQTNFIDWSSLVSILTRIESKLTEEEILSLAEVSYQYPIYKVWRLIGLLRYDLFGFYHSLLAEGSVVEELYPISIENIAVEPMLRRLVVKYQIPDELLPCKTFFRIIEGQARGISKVLGYERAVVTSQYEERSAVFDIRLPRETGLISKVRGFLNRGRSINALQDAQEALVDLQNQLLEESKELALERERSRVVREQLNLVIGNQKVLLWTKDMSFRPTFYSSSIESYLGYTVEEAMQFEGLETLSVQSQAEAERLFQEQMHSEFSGQPYHGIRTLRLLEVRKDGSTFWSDSFISFLRDDFGTAIGIAGVSIDITENILKEAEQESLQQQLDVLRQREFVGQVAGGIAHDFNNSLQAITGFSELVLAQSQTAPLPEDVVQLQKHILRSAGSAAELVKKLLALSRQQSLQMQVIDLKSWLNEFKSMAASMLGNSISLAIESEQSEFIEVDVLQLERAIINLILNARDAMNGEGHLIIRTGAVKDEGKTSLVEIAVEDSGAGIPEEMLTKIFDPFFTSKATDKGTGLGLAVTAGIVGQHDGFVKAKNKPDGGGAIVSVFLPRKTGKDIEATEPLPSFSFRNLHILIVDDEPMVRELCRTFLESEGAVVVEASTGQEGLDVASKQTFDLILMDVVMPGLKGNEVAREIRKQILDQKILFMTGYAGSDAVVKDLSVEVVVPKPFRRTELMNAVESVMLANH